MLEGQSWLLVSPSGSAGRQKWKINGWVCVLSTQGRLFLRRLWCPAWAADPPDLVSVVVVLIYRIVTFKEDQEQV